MEKKQLNVQNSVSQINDSTIQALLTRQQQTIAFLLNKYKDKETINFKTQEKIINQRNQTIDSHSLPNNSLLYKKSDSKYRPLHSSMAGSDSIDKDSEKFSNKKIKNNHRNEQLMLPYISKIKGRNNIKNSRNSINLKQRSYDESLRNSKSREKSELRKQLYKIYAQKQLKKSRAPSFVLKKTNPKKKKKITSASRKETPTVSFKSDRKGEVQQQQQTNQELQPLKEGKQLQIESSDESETQEISATYYEREFREMMKGQCMEEINFLYFSKNQSTKNWTERLLSLFEKHDKQITATRVKSKYLYSFDDKFWTIGIFNTDDF